MELTMTMDSPPETETETAPEDDRPEPTAAEVAEVAARTSAAAAEIEPQTDPDLPTRIARIGIMAGDWQNGDADLAMSIIRGATAAGTEMLATPDGGLLSRPVDRSRPEFTTFIDLLRTLKLPYAILNDRASVAADADASTPAPTNAEPPAPPANADPGTTEPRRPSTDDVRSMMNDPADRCARCGSTRANHGPLSPAMAAGCAGFLDILPPIADPNGPKLGVPVINVNGPLVLDAANAPPAIREYNAPRRRREPEPTIDPDAGLFASAGGFAQALSVALRACPKEKDEPSVSYLVISSEPDLNRLRLGARDGRRWHITYCPTSGPIAMPTITLTRESARELLDTVNFAVDQFPGGANIRFADATGMNTLWAISCGKVEPILIKLQEFMAGRLPEGWLPPKFVAPAPGESTETIIDYDAKSISEATRWPGGGAVVKRDEVDASGRRHLSITDTSGEELAYVVIVARGQKDGLPRTAQTEIGTTLSPKDPVFGGDSPASDAATPAVAKGRKRKVDMTPGIAAGPATKRKADGKFRCERRGPDGTWHVLETGTEAVCLGKLADPRSQEGGATLRVLRPDGSCLMVHEGKPQPMSARDKKKAAAPAAKKKGPRFESNVTPIGARKPVTPPKGAKAKPATASAKSPAKGKKPKR
jgi:hypothetical protein